jgi:RimJ/RimL family protein N-acetyltransferase
MFTVSMVANLKHKLHAAYEVFRKEGLSAFLKETVRKVGVVETYLAYRFDLHNPLPELLEEFPLSVRQATKAEFDLFRTMSFPFPRQAEVRDKFGLDQCYLGIVGGEIAFVVWIYYPHERDRHPTRFCRLRKGEVAIANGITLPQFRGKGVYPRVMRGLLEKLRNEGYRYCYGYIEAENLAAQRAISKVKFVKVGRSWRIQLFYHHRKDPGAGIYVRGPRSRP